ncbi:MAG TPA: hypothetical protein VFS43_40730 [Polyangiaceae bacterium]|nr:hypothetical protein [Polyangiaceae bacterium]
MTGRLDAAAEVLAPSLAAQAVAPSLSGALAALKPGDGEGHRVGPAAYFKAHRFVKADALKGATARREAAARELLGLRTRGYAERADRCAQRLMARYRVSAELALSFVSHVALAQGLEKRARREALVRAVREVTAQVEALLFRSGARHPDAWAADACESEAA